MTCLSQGQWTGRLREEEGLQVREWGWILFKKGGEIERKERKPGLRRGEGRW